MTPAEVQEAPVPVKSSGRGSLLEMWVYLFYFVYVAFKPLFGLQVVDL